MYYSYLCREFDTELILFKKEHVNDDFYMTTPYSARCGPFVRPRFSRLTLVCINQGSEFSVDRFPLCERIEYEPKVKEKTHAHFHKQIGLFQPDPFYVYINDTLTTMYGIRPRPFSLNMVLQSQSLDSYHCVSRLHGTVRTGGSGGSGVLLVTVFLDEPLHSLPLPITSDVNLWDQREAVAWLRENDIEYSLDSHSYPSYQVFRLLGGYFLPFRSVGFRSQRMMYQLYERYARYLQEYTNYYFSRFVAGRTDDYDLYQVIQEFVDATFVIDPQFDHYLNTAPVSRRFEQASVLADPVTRTIRVNSETTVKKLVYHLVNQFQFRKTSLIEYSREPYMRNYYLTATDFDSHKGQQILVSRPVFEMYLSYQPRLYGTSVIDPDRVGPYIWYGTIEEYSPRTRYLVQPISYWNQIIYLFNEWNTSHVNKWTDDVRERTDRVHFHSVIWKPDYQDYLYVPYGYSSSSVNVPACSIVWKNVEQKSCIVQLMIPL
jgi:hypothetical protein